MKNKKSSKKKKGQKGPKWQDASYKTLYTFPEIVSDLLTGFIPAEVIGQIDTATLKREPDTFINKYLSERREDRIWSVRTTKEDTLFLYLLFEFQSSNNKNMALRMLEYAAVHLQDIYRRKVFKPEEKHWPILPIVLYTGASPWTAPLECSECRIPTFPSLL
ncbi:MAG: Rpn family recombination-promoting nuclease/putative transposase, partial [Desulfovibrionaceae bacterium]|nr:Rpn family recombination-promoting nuclease/putative transposase [Desulfovibrionaceae bacterium]